MHSSSVERLLRNLEGAQAMWKSYVNEIEPKNERLLANETQIEQKYIFFN